MCSEISLLNARLLSCSVIRSTDGTYGTVIEETGEVNGMLKTILDDDGDIAGPFVDHPVLVEKFYCMARNRDMSSPFGIVSGMKRQYIDVPSSLTGAFDATVSQSSSISEGGEGLEPSSKESYIRFKAITEVRFQTWLALSGSFILALSVLSSYSWLVYRPASMTVADAIFKWLFVMLAALVQEGRDTHARRSTVPEFVFLG